MLILNFTKRHYNYLTNESSVLPNVIHLETRMYIGSYQLSQITKNMPSVPPFIIHADTLEKGKVGTTSPIIYTLEEGILFQKQNVIKPSLHQKEP